MKRFFALTLFLAFGCSSTDELKTVDYAETGTLSITKLENLNHIEASVTRFAHPLVCGKGGDYPNGRELVFRVDPSTDPVHAVFPKSEQSPKSLEGKFQLNGFYQKIQKHDRYKHLNPGKEYTYFVVTSWEHDK